MQASEELDRELSGSPLWNPDLAPTPPSRRTWSTYNIAALRIGMAVVITTYTLASGLMQQGMTWYQALITILLGNVIVLLPMILNAHAGTKYGISFPVLCRASFGVKGANVAAILRAIVACGWFGIQTWIGGLALDALIKALWPGWANVGLSTAISFGIFWLIQVYIILKGTEGIKVLESWSAPLLLGGGLLLLWWAARNGGGMSAILSNSVKLQQGSTPFWTLFPAALTANVGYWATLSHSTFLISRATPKASGHRHSGRHLDFPGRWHSSLSSVLLSQARRLSSLAKRSGIRLCSSAALDRPR
jgi:NCS1 family nucleobase:cation symporter-1